MKRVMFGLVIIVAGMSVIFFGIREMLGDNLDSISELKAKGVVSRIINKAVSASFAQEEVQQKLFDVEKADGVIRTVQPNTPLLNRMISDFSLLLQDEYEKTEPKKVRIPMGAITGSKLLSMTDMGTNIKILPLSVSSCSYESAFESQGINQTKYMIYVNVKSTVKIIKPFSGKTMEVENRILLAELMIIGDVPDSYVNVPKDDILDAIN